MKKIMIHLLLLTVISVPAAVGCIKSQARSYETSDEAYGQCYILDEEVIDIKEKTRIKIYGEDPCTDFEPGYYEDISPEDDYFKAIEELARCVEAEAGNQSQYGKRLVVDVILNRAEDSDWPDTVIEVIHKPYEFSSYWDGRMAQMTPTEETYEAIRMEIRERSFPSLYYFAEGNYSRYGTPWKKVEDHYFSKK